VHNWLFLSTTFLNMVDNLPSFFLSLKLCFLSTAFKNFSHSLLPAAAFKKGSYQQFEQHL
jgi:hypothetical protein